MKTLEMMQLAKNNNKVFKANKLYYSNKNGFSDSEGVPWEGYAFRCLNDLFDVDKWEEVKNKVDFITAIKAMNNGKKIYCIHDEDCIYYDNDFELIDEENKLAISPDEILEGEWYIEG